VALEAGHMPLSWLILRGLFQGTRLAGQGRPLDDRLFDVQRKALQALASVSHDMAVGKL
jgi:hypothetical protein